jgi:hypothetical protein
VSTTIGSSIWACPQPGDPPLVHLGSFRGSGGFIAELLNDQTSSRRHDYLDFYLGTIGVGDRADLTPVYRMIFRRLAAQGCDWTYAFPRLHVNRVRQRR